MSVLDESNTRNRQWSIKTSENTIKRGATLIKALIDNNRHEHLLVQLTLFAAFFICAGISSAVKFVIIDSRCFCIFSRINASCFDGKSRRKTIEG